MIKVCIGKTKEGENPSLAVRWLLLTGLQDACGLRVSAEGIVKDEKGKPYLLGCPDLFISLSHSGSYLACAFGDKPVGIDIEVWKTHSRWQKIVEKMHPREQEKMRESCGGGIDTGAVEPVADFCDLWVRKESFVKAIGEGLRLPLAAFDTTEDEVRQTVREGSWYLKSRKFFTEGLSIGICTLGDEEILFPKIEKGG